MILTREKIQVTRFREDTGSEMLGESTGRDSRALKGGSSSLWSNGLVEVILPYDCIPIKIKKGIDNLKYESKHVFGILIMWNHRKLNS